MPEGNTMPEDQNPAPPIPAGPDWFSRQVPGHTPGLSELPADYLDLLPEHLRFKAALFLNELDSLGSRSISADTGMALIDSVVEGQRSHITHELLGSVLGVLKEGKDDLLHYHKTVHVNTIYLRPPGSPGTPEAVAMEARLMEAICRPRLRTIGVTYYKKEENQADLMWTGDGEPDSGPGEWIPQVFKKWCPKP